MGNVRSIRRNLIKSPAANDRGYSHVGLHRDAKQERAYVHPDRLEHGTDTRGEKNGLAKLSKEQVLHIRGISGKSLAQLAMQYGVSKSTIADIKAGRTWAHI